MYQTLLVTLLTTDQIYAQGYIESKDITIGNIHPIYSESIKEDRPYWVSLPPTYYNTSIYPIEYPVLYILDYQSLFVPFSGIVKYMSGGINSQIPEMIIVGIQATNRTRDATPTFSKIDYTGQESEGLSSSGGADLFLEFINKELIPEINSTYRTTDFKILAGHSLDGLTVIHTLLSSPNSFNAYISIDPSLWWDNQEMLKRAKKLDVESHFNNQYLFLAQANNVLSIPTRVSEFAEFMGEEENLNWKHKFYPNEDHNSVSLPSIYDALSDLFYGHKIDQDAYYFHPERIQKQYESISRKLNAHFSPPLFTMNSMGNMFFNSEIEKAIIYFKLNTDNFPDSKIVWRKLGDAYLRNNQCKLALHCFSKLLALDSTNDDIKKQKVN